ncbi:MAG: hypothetical protein WBL63_07765 [Candidatus Acidiferrum sp.]
MNNWNYFNYFTEIEEYFWKKRGAHLLVSPLDWAIMETWQKAGVPLECALKGIDRAFESYQRSRRGAGKPLKSLAYCTDSVLEAAEEQQEAAVGAQSQTRCEPREPFSREELQAYLRRNAEMLRNAAGRYEKTHASLAVFLGQAAEKVISAETLLEAPGKLDLEDLERRMTIVDEKVHASLLTHASEELLLKIRREVDSQLAAYRRKMKAEQLALVEKQYSQKRLLDEYKLPRLSLYYFSP